MKKLILAGAVFLTLSSSAFAFIPQIHFYVNREVAVSRVWNTTNLPMVCNGYAYGQTYRGVVLNSWVNNLVINPGVYAEVYVHSNFYDPMAQAWAQIDCQLPW